MTRIRSMMLGIGLYFCVQMPGVCLADFSIQSLTPNVTISAGQTTSVSMLITGDANSTALLEYGAEFKINPIGTATQPLLFTATQPDSYLVSPQNPTNYVFYGNSTDASLPGGLGYPVASRAGTFNGSQSDLILSDITANVSPQTLTNYDPSNPNSNGNSLLVVLTFQAPTTVTADESFEIDLLNNPNTYFLSAFGDSYSNYSYSPVTINVLAPVPVPVPASMILTALGLFFTGVTSPRRWRTSLGLLQVEV